MSKYLSQHLNFRIGLAPDADAWGADPATDVVDLSEYEKVSFVVMHAAGATGTAVVTVEACTLADGTGAAAIPFMYRKHGFTAAVGALTAVAATGVTIAAGANQLLIAEVKSDDLPDGKPFVRVQITEGVDDPVDGAVLIVMGGARYSSGDPAAALA